MFEFCSYFTTAHGSATAVTHSQSLSHGVRCCAAMSHSLPSAPLYPSKASHTPWLCSTSSCRAAHTAQPLPGAIPSACSPPQLSQVALAPALLLTRAGPQQCSWTPWLAWLEGLPQCAPSLWEGFPAGEKPSDRSGPLNNGCSHSQQSDTEHFPPPTNLLWAWALTCWGQQWGSPKEEHFDGGTASLLSPPCPLSVGTAPGGKAGEHRGWVPPPVCWDASHIQTAATAMLGSSCHTVC